MTPDHAAVIAWLREECDEKTRAKILVAHGANGARGWNEFVEFARWHTGESPHVLATFAYQQYVAERRIDVLTKALREIVTEYAPDRTLAGSVASAALSAIQRKTVTKSDHGK